MKDPQCQKHHYQGSNLPWKFTIHLYFQELLKDLQLKTEPVNKETTSEKEEQTDYNNFPLNLLADVALSKEFKMSASRVSLFLTIIYYEYKVRLVKYN